MNETFASRDPVDLLAEQFLDRYRRGESPDVDAYAAAHPQWSAQIRDLFPTILAMESLKREQQAEPDNGRAAVQPIPLKQLGDYRIIQEIGRGGMGIVYEAEQESLSRHVAVKVLPRQVLLDSKHLDRFRRESRAAARLHHTNIVPVFGVGEQDGFHYYVMQYIRGVALDEVVARVKQLRSPSSMVDAENESSRDIESNDLVRSLLQDHFVPGRSPDSNSSAPEAIRKPPLHRDHDRRDNGTVSHGPGDTPTALPAPRLTFEYWRAVARIGLQVAEALAYAHEQGTLHRDIKPANLLLDRHGVVWVTDFGLAKRVEHDVSQTDNVVGTFRYMAPEQWHGDADPRSDIYGLGMTLYELLTLRSAYDDDQRRRALLQQVAIAEPTPLRKIQPHLPRDLETIVLKAVAPEPERRYASAALMVEDLQAFLEDRPIRARRVTLVERCGRWCRRNPALASLTALVSALLTLTLVVIALAYVKTEAALDSESVARSKAEATLDISLEALDRVYQRFVPERIVATADMTVSADGEQIQLPVPPVISKETAALLEDILEFYRRLAEQGSQNPRLREDTAKANRRVGDIRQRLGQFPQAETAYLQAAELYRQLKAQSQQPAGYDIEIARIQNELGNVYQLMQRQEQARQAFESALTLLQPLASDSSPEAQFELARTYYYLGRRPPIPPGPPRFVPGSGGMASSRRGPYPDPATAGEPFSDPRPRLGRRPERPPLLSPELETGGTEGEPTQRAIELLQSLAIRYPAIPEYQHLLGLCYRDLGNVRGFVPARQRSIEQAIEIFEQLCQDYPENSDYAHDLAVTYASLDVRDWFGAEPDQLQAEVQLRMALEMLNTLTRRFPQVPRYHTSQVDVLLKLAMILQRQADSATAEMRKQLEAEAVVLLREARGILSIIQAEQSDSLALPQQMAAIRCGQMLASLLWRQGETDEASQVFQATADTLKSMLDDSQRPRLVELHLAETLNQLARMAQQAGDPESASSWRSRSQSLRRSAQRSP